MLQSRFVAPEQRVIASAGFEVGLQALDQQVVLVAHRGVRVFEDGLGARGSSDRFGRLVARPLQSNVVPWQEPPASLT